MAIIASDIKFYLSGGTSNSDGDASLGGAISTTELTTGLHDLFDQVSSSESSAGSVEFRCIYVKNTHGSLSLTTAKAWISANVSGDTELDIAIGASAINVAEQGPLANELTVPTGPTFTKPATQGAGLSIGDLPAGGFQSLWVRRTVTGGAVAAADTVTIDVGGDTAA